MYEDLPGILKNQYGLCASGVTPCDGGLSALAYRVDTPEGPYFLKVYDKSKAAAAQWTATIDSYMPVLAALNRDAGLKGRIAEPVCAAGGRYQYEDERRVCLLFRYIPGGTAGSLRLARAQALNLAHTVALLHRHSPRDIPGSYDNMTEDFGLPFCDRLEEYIGRLGRPGDDEVRAVIAGSRSRLEEAVGAARRMASACTALKPVLVFCHTDIHGFNVVIRGETPVLVDWEGLKLAPREHDLMFFCNEPYFADFMRIYRTYHPNFAIDRVMLDFYLLRRKLEDIWAFTQSLTSDAQGDAERARDLGLLRDICLSVG